MSTALTTATNVNIDLDEDAGRPVAQTGNGDQIIIVEEGAAPEIINEDAGDLDKLPARAKPNDDGSVTLPLLYPQSLTTRKDGKVNERKFDTLTFHRLNGADQRAIGAASDEMSAVVAFARSTRLNQAIMNALFDKMDAADIADGGRVLNHFLTSGRRTGR